MELSFLTIVATGNEDGRAPLLVGVDVGGTKVAVRAEAASGEMVIDRTLPATGWAIEPADQAAEWLLGRVREALPPGSTVRAAAIGAQRCNTEERARALELALRDRGMPTTVVNDAMLLVPAAGLQDGLGVIAGTGSIGVGRTAAGRFLVAGGWGWVLGDEGSAVDLVRKAIRAVLVAAEEGRPDGELLRGLQTAFEARDLDQLVLAVTEHPSPARLARAAPAVFLAAAAGSTLARQVIEAGAGALATLVDRLRRSGAVGRVVVASGGVITHQRPFFEGFRDRVRRTNPDLEVTLLQGSPVAGAMVLARRLAVRTSSGPGRPL